MLNVLFNAMFGEVIRTVTNNAKIIWNGNTTICIFQDGQKIIARPCEGQQFDREVGVAMCIMKRLFGSRRKFLQFVDSGKDQTPEMRQRLCQKR